MKKNILIKKSASDFINASCHFLWVDHSEEYNGESS